MKVVAINGSPRVNGNTFVALKNVLDQLNDDGIETTILHVGNKLIKGCVDCKNCSVKKDRACILKDDVVNEYLAKMVEADGIVIGSPTYYSGITGTLKSFLDRCFYVAAANGGLFSHKVGAGVVTARRAGGTQAYDQINKYFQISGMLSVGSNYWNIVYGLKRGEAHQDAEGIQTMHNLGNNMAWVLKMQEVTKSFLKPPEQLKPRKVTNFIRSSEEDNDADEAYA